MKDYELVKLIQEKMKEEGVDGKEITVFLPRIGTAHIQSVVYHASCDEYHIKIRTLNDVAQEN